MLTFQKALVERIADAMPLEKKPRWIEGLRDMPASNLETKIFLWNAAERAEPPRLLNDDRQVILSRINILIVIANSPRPSDKESQTLENIKLCIRKTLQGWTPPPQRDQYFLPCTLLGATPATTASAARDGKRLWIETLQCKHIAIATS